MEKEPNMEHGIGYYVNDIIYTNLARRFGGSIIVVNLAPKKTCSFDCLYCYGGPTELKTLEIKKEDTFPLECVKEGIEEGFKILSEKGFKAKRISFSGFTEPTLYPNFPDIVAYVHELREKFFKIPTVIYTNGTLLREKEIREAINKFDQKFFKLDTGDEETFQKINRPLKGIYLDNIVKYMSEFEDKEILTMLVDRKNGNFNSIKSKEYIDKIKQIKPNVIWLGDVDTPIPTEYDYYKIMTTSQQRLLDLGDFISKETAGMGIDVNVLKIRDITAVHPQYYNVIEK